LEKQKKKRRTFRRGRLSDRSKKKGTRASTGSTGDPNKLSQKKKEKQGKSDPRGRTFKVSLRHSNGVGGRHERGGSKKGVKSAGN